MSIVKGGIAAAIGLGVYLAAVPGMGQWTVAVSRKAIGGQVTCEWGSLLGYPWKMEDFATNKAKLEKSLASTQRDEALGIVQVKTPGRSFWVKEKGAYLDGKDLIALLLAERDWNASAIPSARVRKGDTVLDVGAHVGTFTDFALQNGASKVILLEPDPVNVECLRRNFPKEIADGSVVIVPEGAWSSEQTIELSVGVANSGTGSMVNRESGAKMIRVPVRPIDKILADLKIEKIDYIKMDIEGAEKDALKGARATIASNMPRIHLDANHEPDDATALPALIASLKTGYQTSKGACECDKENGNQFAPHTLYLEHQ